MKNSILIFTIISILSFSFYSIELIAESQETTKKSSDMKYIEETLDKIAGQSKDFSDAAKSIQDGTVYKKPETIDHVLDTFEHQYRSLKNIIYYFERLADVNAINLRPIVLAEWLSFREVLSDSFDSEHDFSVAVYKNLAVDGPYPSGIDPKDIKEPEIRKDYEDRLAKNTQLAYERRAQLTLRQLLEDATKEMEKFIITAYESEPRADDELIKAMEKYKLPKDARVEILSKIGVIYEGFRQWESSDGLFKATAKFVSLDKGEVMIEKPDGKQTTIELSVLRKDDQDYVKLQLAPETKTPTAQPKD